MEAYEMNINIFIEEESFLNECDKVGEYTSERMCENCINLYMHHIHHAEAFQNEHLLGVFS